MISPERTTESDKESTAQIRKSNYLSRDLSWLQFNYRVLDQAKHIDRSIFDRLKFLMITAHNLDEFCTIRLGSLYNYIDYGKKRVDYSGLREIPFRNLILSEIQKYINHQSEYYLKKLKPLFKKNKFLVEGYDTLSMDEAERADRYFAQTIYPMLTPMVFDNYHTFPALKSHRLLFGVVTKTRDDEDNTKRISFIQVPSNIPRFYEIIRPNGFILFVPVESLIHKNISLLFKNVEIVSVSLFRINRNEDFVLEESEDIDANFLEELRAKIQTRKKGRVVRLDTVNTPDPWIMHFLKIQWDIDDRNIMLIPKGGLLDYSGFKHIIDHKEFKEYQYKTYPAVNPISFPKQGTKDIFEILKKRDILMHHPYNEMEPLLNLLEQSAEDTGVLSIKITLYRVAKESRVIAALLKAAENGKHVSVLFEVKARFDEENNLKEATRLRKAGCFVIYGVGNLKTHTKLLMVVRKERGGDKVFRYVHLASGNYNEVTSRLYTDIGMLTASEVYANDVSEFFNAITGHSKPSNYHNLITSPKHMRMQLCSLVEQETSNARNHIPSGIVLKLNSLQDRGFIDKLYKASQEGVQIKLIVRGICCLRPGRKGLSENIEVISIVGELLEHSRIYYFHNAGNPKVYIGSADAMVRSFDKRVESLFMLSQEISKKETINILYYNLKDNVNAYTMHKDGKYTVKEIRGEPPFDIHKEFYNVTEKEIWKKDSLFSKSDQTFHS